MAACETAVHQLMPMSFLQTRSWGKKRYPKLLKKNTKTFAVSNEPVEDAARILTRDLFRTSISDRAHNCGLNGSSSSWSIIRVKSAACLFRQKVAVVGPIHKDKEACCEYSTCFACRSFWRSVRDIR